jgi:hypothetical protein
MKILVYTPRLRLYGRAVQAAFAMLHAAPCPVVWMQSEHDNPHPTEGYDGNQNLVHLYSQARTVALQGDYTHLLTLEDDMVPPVDAIARLAACDAPVAYSLYCWRRAPYHWSAYRTLHETDGASISDNNPWQAAEQAHRDTVIDVAGVGLGCTLIRRDALERVPFRCAYGVGGSVDWYFALDCQAANVRQVAHLGVRCGHITPVPSLRILWPNPDADGHDVACKRLYRSELL